ncbi:hypothetical protein I6H88_13980 [Elizabethkingia bruuniana]|uniref:Uncharacterized protein n=1 Tax=Elizabethkingia bruuniana TaxID=1756149 RepID=A0A7T7ZXG4_9FLAO|nr:hypothetical protein [Elizabethkingia bruuniana]AQX84058.1 hypothetical protein AYC65_03050 [Elizabethkingia bruuniana]QQN57550.1 hypothetical protein I6H88_13980 [Elizabethkingia bruuniana]
MKKMVPQLHWDKDAITIKILFKMRINMKLLLTVFLIILSNSFFAQKDNKKTYYTNYIVLDSLKNVYGDNVINKFTLNTKELYGFDKSVEIYNVLYNNAVLLISALPDIKGNENWIKIDINAIKKDILTRPQLKEFIMERYLNNISEKKTLKYGLVKKIDGEYYVPKMTLIEYFYVKSYKFPFIPAYGTIDINGPIVTIKEMEKSYREQIPDRGFPLSPYETDYSFSFPIYARNYLSKIYTLNGNNAYQFWTLDNYRTADYYSTYRGIDRFIYIPEKGIIGGSYDFYFSFNSSSELAKKIKENIINEKVMIAEELK